MRILSTDSV